MKTKTSKKVSTSNSGYNKNTKTKASKMKTQSSATNYGLSQKLKKLSKIDHIPKNVATSIPFKGMMQNGIIETSAGVFTKTYKLTDVNFKIAQEEEQAAIFTYFMDFLNSFNQQTKWQFTIFNHAIDKRATVDDMRLKGQRDGLNKYRQEMNEILLHHLSVGNNSIVQDKYLTVAIEDRDADHAVQTFTSRLDAEISNKLRRITKTSTKALSSKERIKLLYSIYNQDMDYRFATGIYDGKETLDLRHLLKQGLSIKDMIGPPSLDFSNPSYFMMDNTYAQALYLEKVPTYLSTDYISDLADIQSNLLISITSETMDNEDAIKMVRAQLASIDAQASGIGKNNLENGYLGANLPPELEAAQTNARELMKDITQRNQNMFFVTLTVVVFAKSKEELDENIALIKSVAAKHIAPLKPLKFQQEFGLNTALPLCRNDLFVEKLCTTESAAVFIPYNTQEISQKNAVFYGLNQLTKSMVLYDRLSGANYNGLIFGYSGSGKSFTAKVEMINVLLGKPDAQVFVIDPQGEYYPLADSLNGEHIILAPGSNVYINPLDMDIATDKDHELDPITMKADFVISMLEIMLGKNRVLDPTCRTIIDRCIRALYAPYIEELRRLGNGITCKPSLCPTLTDLYYALLDQREHQATQMAEILEMYTTGSFNSFSRRTNVKTNKKFVVYDIKSLGTGMRDLGLHVCVNDVWNRMIANSKNHVYTWFYIDEFHILLQSESTTVFLKQIWKMARKWLGVPTGIMQNTEDLLRNADSRNIVNNTSFVIMLREPKMDRQNLSELFGLSDAQIEYITESDPGSGLLYNGKVTIPFENKFPKKTKLYQIMTTQHDANSAFV